MLYDNAQLARTYLHGYQVTGNEFYKRITTKILDYAAREMTDPNDGFYSSQDSAIPLLIDRPQIEGKATAYVCENFACQMPVTEAEALQAQLDSIL